MPIATSPVARADLREFLESGPSLMIATRDDRMVVESTRCSAAALAPDGRVYFVVPMPESARTVANLEQTRVVALSAANVRSYSTVQLKGSDCERIDWPESAAAVARHRERFCGRLAPNIGEAILSWSREGVAFAFTPSEMFDQTPGPNAGLALPR